MKSNLKTFAKSQRTESQLSGYGHRRVRSETLSNERVKEKVRLSRTKTKWAAKDSRVIAINAR